MADFGSTELDAFAAEVRKELAAMYPPELRDPQAKSDPEAVWGGRAFEGSADPQVTWMKRMARQGLDRADLAQGIRRRADSAPSRPA